MKEPTDEERARVSGPVMRTFENIAKRWDLPERRRLQILGCNQRDFRNWVRLARRHQPLVLETNTLMRISAILGVFAGLRQFGKTAEEEKHWLLSPIPVAPFAGQAPIGLLSESFERQIDVRRYLEAIVPSSIPNEADAIVEPYSIEWH
ncbi:DUF2384 domain-containing protein [Boseaceae bacterium BT-24-1]|nr:DUF2384 domain-containing protein [Boseaceae bacterium BT-24-1]